VTGEAPSAKGDTRVSDQPRYMQIVEVLKREIESEQREVGSLLPSESELREQFSVSRHTIREALRTLRDEGLIESRQGAGSRIKRSSKPVYTHSIGTVAELLQYATEARYAIDKSAVVIADEDLKKKIGCAVGSRWLRVEGFRYLKDETLPLCWTEIFILSEYSGVGVLIGRQTGTIYSFIENMYGVRVEQVDQSLFVVTMPPPAADGLGVERDSQSIVLRRIYRLVDGTVPLVAVNYHVPDRLTLNWTLHRTSS